MKSTKGSLSLNESRKPVHDGDAIVANATADVIIAPIKIVT